MIFLHRDSGCFRTFRGVPAWDVPVFPQRGHRSKSGFRAHRSAMGAVWMGQGVGLNAISKCNFQFPPHFPHKFRIFFHPPEHIIPPFEGKKTLLITNPVWGLNKTPRKKSPRHLVPGLQMSKMGRDQIS